MKDLTKGIGIGLSTAWVLSEAIGGSIHLSSKNNGETGTTVTFKVSTTTEDNLSTFHNDLFVKLNEQNKSF